MKKGCALKINAVGKQEKRMDFFFCTGHAHEKHALGWTYSVLSCAALIICVEMTSCSRDLNHQNWFLPAWCSSFLIFICIWLILFRWCEINIKTGFGKIIVYVSLKICYFSLFVTCILIGKIRNWNQFLSRCRNSPIIRKKRI